jgi:hypothetical protein
MPLFSRLRDDRSANFATMAGILMVPLFGCIGLAVDYTQASSIRSQLQNAADVAALGSIGENSPGMQEANAMAGDGPVRSAREDALNLFSIYTLTGTGLEIESLDAEILKAGTELTSRVSYEASVPTSFMGLFGTPRIKLSGISTAVVRTAPYMDFHLLLDNSPSMGVGATPSDINALVENTPDSCAFACHDLSDSNNYYNLAKDLGVAMRIDIVRQATQRLMQTAEETRKNVAQFRMATYSFGEAATALGLTQLNAMTADLAAARQAAGNLDLMTIPYQNYDNDQQTDFDGTFAALDARIEDPGDGNSPESPQQYVFFVSDGVGDSRKPSPHCTKRTTGQRCMEPIDVRACEALKERGIRIAVLYTTYLPLPTNGWYNDWIRPFQNEIGSRMAECATPGLYFEVSPTEGIAEAMEALFFRIVTNPRLTS